MDTHDTPIEQVSLDEQLPCSGKLLFATKEQAQAAATANSYWYKGPLLKAYQCRYCGHWHLSSRS